VDKKCLETFPLAFYAAQHWVDHAKYEDVVSRVQDGIEEIFNPSKPYLAAWTWIHGVNSNQVRETIQDLRGRPTPPRASALYYAVLCGFSWLADSLIVMHGENASIKCGNHRTPLHAASFKGHLDAARLLLAHGVNVNTTNNYNKTPLFSACNGGHLDVMRLLLEHGAKVDFNFRIGLLLHEASYSGRAVSSYVCYFSTTPM
jgi:hypothetical protein